MTNHHSLPYEGYRDAASMFRGQTRRREDLFHAIMMLVAQIHHVDGRQLFHATRGPARVARIRQIGVYLAHVEAGFSLSDIARRLGRDRTTIGHACRLVEDLRDDPAVDALLTVMARTIQRLEAAS